ncbi:Outer membrane porin F precursor [Aquimixticola soesokkakensis]|uniref:Outer membrane porin F n=1 Tax=Aquimixticola soesokkakensis TaxID=1519096 RepID=A0A1Y5TA57_9RHOB|nr:OmpA family protein [Aquimixticola soesokkakensis]SLN59388.1 Outer membrane porin F precursor [Aquimixticola soesokkakensis]
MEIFEHGRKMLAGAAMVAFAISTTAAQAQMVSGEVNGEVYAPTIWIDPDGCEHWVMDDGVEGYMDLKVDRQGIPTCHPIQACMVMNTDQLFATDRYAISAAGRARLEDFFRSAGATAYIIVGHTDSRASDEYNMKLSYNRANAVAKVGASIGANISDVRGYGERMPKASNATAAGMQENRRVEIICIK